MKITREEFIKSLTIKEGVRTMIANTSLNREFHTAVINGEVYSGFRSEHDIINLKNKMYE